MKFQAIFVAIIAFKCMFASSVNNLAFQSNSHGCSIASASINTALPGGGSVKAIRKTTTNTIGGKTTTTCNTTTTIKGGNYPTPGANSPIPGETCKSPTENSKSPVECSEAPTSGSSTIRTTNIPLTILPCEEVITITIFKQLTVTCNETFTTILSTVVRVPQAVGSVDKAITSVSDTAVSIIKILSVVNEEVLSNPNQLCELSVIVTAAIQILFERVTKFTTSVSSIASNVTDNDIVVLKLCTEAVTAVVGNLVEVSRGFLNHGTDIVSQPSSSGGKYPVGNTPVGKHPGVPYGPTSSSDAISVLIYGLTSSFSSITISLKSTVTSVHTISRIEFASTLKTITTSVLSCTKSLTNPTDIVTKLLGSGTVGGIFSGHAESVVGTVTGTVKGLLSHVGSITNILGGPNESLGAISRIVSQVSKTISTNTISATQSINIAEHVVGNISLASSSCTSILGKLGNSGGFKIVSRK